MGHPYRIVVEDEDALRHVLIRFIMRYEPSALVDAFDTGSAALAHYQSSGADLIFSNHAMPGMSGPTLTRHIRAHNRHIPIITTSGDPANATAVLDAGATLFFPAHTLLAHLAHLLACFRP